MGYYYAIMLLGAEGLLDAFLTCLQNVGVDTEKLVVVTTDGENANTGKWGEERLKQYERNTMLFSSSAHQK